MMWLRTRRWGQYITISGLEEQTQNCKTALLYNCSGIEAICMYNGFQFETSEEKVTNKNIEKFDTLFPGQAQEFFDSQFNRRNQEPGLIKM